MCISGARVIMACRDMDRANKAAEEVRKRSGNGNVVVKQLDLASLQSVRHLAKDILATEERLDILINNAGKLVKDALEHLVHQHLSEAPLTILYLLTFRCHELSSVEDCRWIRNAVWHEPPGPLPLDQLPVGLPEEVDSEPHCHSLQPGSRKR